MEIEFRIIENHSLFKVDINGRVYKRRTLKSEWRELSPQPAKGTKPPREYMVVKLCSDSGEKKIRYVHHLVLEAFVGPRPPGMEACHFPNPEPTDNRLCNLRWDTHKANMADMKTVKRLHELGVYF